MALSLFERANHVAPSSSVMLYTKAWRSSGTGLIAQELAQALAALGVRVDFLSPQAEDNTFEAHHPNLTRIRPGRELSQSAPRVWRIVASCRRVLGSVSALILGRLRNKAFLVSIPDPLVFSVPAFALLRMTGAHLLYVVHDPLPHAWRLPKGLRWIERAGFAATYFLATRLVVLTATARETLIREFAIAAEKIEIIEHGAFALRDSPRPLMPGRNRFLMFGTLRRNKGIREAIDGVIEARRRGVDVSLLIAGEPHSDDTAYWNECRVLAAANPDAIDVREGYVANTELPSLIEATDAFLLPYRDFDSASGVAVLAASNARPIVASSVGGMAELFETGAPGVTIASPVGVHEVADALISFAEQDQEALSARCAAYRDRLLEEKSWPSIARQYKRLIEQASS